MPGMCARPACAAYRCAALANGINSRAFNVKQCRVRLPRYIGALGRAHTCTHVLSGPAKNYINYMVNTFYPFVFALSLCGAVLVSHSVRTDSRQPSGNRMATPWPGSGRSAAAPYTLTALFPIYILNASHE